MFLYRPAGWPVLLFEKLPVPQSALEFPRLEIRFAMNSAPSRPNSRSFRHLKRQACPGSETAERYPWDLTTQNVGLKYRQIPALFILARSATGNQPGL